VNWNVTAEAHILPARWPLTSRNLIDLRAGAGRNQRLAGARERARRHWDRTRLERGGLAKPALVLRGRSS